MNRCLAAGRREIHTVDHWIVRVQYAFAAADPTIDELDELVGGNLLPPYDGVSHAMQGDALRATLEWRVPSLDEARRATAKLESLPLVSDVCVTRLRHDRVIQQIEFSIRASDAVLVRPCASHVRRAFPRTMRQSSRSKDCGPATRSSSGARRAHSRWRGSSSPRTTRLIATRGGPDEPGCLHGNRSRIQVVRTPPRERSSNELCVA